MTLDYLWRCVEGESGRAKLAIAGYGNADTAAYFARSAAHYAHMLQVRLALRRRARYRK